MNYKDIIIEQHIEDYKEQHRIFYQTLSSMIYDISFLQNAYDLQDWKILHDFITLKMMYRNIFENLITKVYRCFFDNSGNGSTNIFKYKNKVLKLYLKEEYRQPIIDKIKLLPIESKEFKASFEELRNNYKAIRNGFIGHRLLVTSDDATVDLDDIKQLVEYGCELLQTLSFEPSDFYSFTEGDGFDFSKENETTKSLTYNFIMHSFLTSRYITKIECAFDELCPEDIKERLEKIIQEINICRDS